MREKRSYGTYIFIAIIEIVFFAILYFTFVFPIQIKNPKLSYNNYDNKKQYIQEMHTNKHKLTENEMVVIIDRLQDMNIFEMDTISFEDVRINIIANKRHNRGSGSIELIGNYTSIDTLKEMINLIGLKESDRGDGRIYTSDTDYIGNYRITLKKNNQFSLVINADLVDSNNIASESDLLKMFLNLNEANMKNIQKEMNKSGIVIAIILVATNGIVYLVFKHIIKIKKKKEKNKF